MLSDVRYRQINFPHHAPVNADWICFYKQILFDRVLGTNGFSTLHAWMSTFTSHLWINYILEQMMLSVLNFTPKYVNRNAFWHLLNVSGFSQVCISKYFIYEHVMPHILQHFRNTDVRRRQEKCNAGS